MSNCVMKGCKNQSSKNKKLDGITFHTFPVRDIKAKNKWIEVIRDSRNEPLWHPNSRSVVCSAHFESGDFYFTKKGLRRVLHNKYPKILPEYIEFVNQSQPPKDSTDVLVPPVSDLNQPSTPCVQFAEPDPLFIDLNQSTVPIQSDQEQLQQKFDMPKTPKTRRKRKTPTNIYDLWKKSVKLEKQLNNNKTKINTLNETIRCLVIRKKSLERYLDSLKKPQQKT